MMDMFLDNSTLSFIGLGITLGIYFARNEYIHKCSERRMKRIEKKLGCSDV